MTKDKAYFISDAHLGEKRFYRKDREKDLISFFKKIESDADYLFILGDFFDFWIEYKHAIRPDYFNILYALKSLNQKGVTIHYVAGNHDFALGTFLTDKIGIEIHLDSLKLDLQGKRIHLAHGDGLVKSDVGYLYLRRILRNPFNQKLFKLLHPNTAISFASFFSDISHRYLNNRDKSSSALYRNLAKGYLDKGNDIVVFGHTHCAELTNYNEKIYCNTGAWTEKKYTYAVLVDGVISLEEFIP